MQVKHNHNLLTVNFPNGLTRKRNCQSSFVPEDREFFKRKLYYFDIASHKPSSPTNQNQFKEFRQENHYPKWPWVLIAMVLLIGIFTFVYLMIS